MSLMAGSPEVSQMVVTKGLLQPIIQLLDSTYDMKQEVSRDLDYLYLQ